jgi:hypothetical protein
MTAPVLPPSTKGITALLSSNGHHPVTGHSDGFTLLQTADEGALVLTYWSEAKDAHDHLVGGHIHRRRRALRECASLIRAAGHLVTCTPTVQNPGRAPVESAIIFLAPEPEPEPADPLLCQCDPAELCGRAAHLAVAAVELATALTAAGAALLDALHEAAIEPVDHALWGPEGAAALLDHARNILAALAPPPDETAVRDLECRGCTAVACLASNGLARTALERSAHLAAVRATSLAAARTILDRSHLALTPGDRWHDTLKEAAEQLFRVYGTAAAALSAPADESHGRYCRSARRRCGLPVNLRRGGARYWFVRWGRAVWH